MCKNLRKHFIYFRIKSTHDTDLRYFCLLHLRKMYVIKKRYTYSILVFIHSNTLLGKHHYGKKQRSKTIDTYPTLFITQTNDKQFYGKPGNRRSLTFF